MMPCHLIGYQKITPLNENPMPAIHETAYPRIKPHLSPKELENVFKPNEEEFYLLNSNTKKSLPAPRLGFMMFLKCYQYLGRPIKIDTVCTPIKQYLCEQLHIDNHTDLSRYDSSARKRHIKIIRAYLKINPDKTARRNIMKSTALHAASTKENLADIINCIIDELIKSQFELPTFDSLVRLTKAARIVANNHFYEKIVNALSDEQKKQIDEISGLEEIEETDGEKFLWPMLKLEPKKPTLTNIKGYVQYVHKMKVLRQQLNVDFDFIPPARMEQLRNETMAADIDDISTMRKVKRYALVSIFIRMKAMTAIDDLVQVFITWIKKIEAQAKSKLEAYRLQQAEETDTFILHFYHTLMALKNNHTAKDKILAIEKQLGGQIDELIEQCQTHLKLTSEHHIQWMLKPYGNKRSVVFHILENLAIASSTQDKSIELALQFILHHRNSTKEWIDLAQDKSIQPELALLSGAWFKAVTGVKREKNQTIRKINHRYYEMAVFTVLSGDLSCSDAFVKDGYIFDDPNKQYITWEEFHQEVDNYCDKTKLPKSSGELIAFLQERLRATAKAVDKQYHSNAYLVIEDHLPILKKLTKKKEHPQLNKFKQMIADEMPVKSIVDVIVDVENWLNLSGHFKPLSGYKTKIPEYPPRFVATALSYGCNMGPTQTERSLPKFTRKQIAWLFNHHVTDQKLIKAVQTLINRYNAFDLPKYWGPGDSASVDGTFWDMYEQNLLAAHHIRYGRYGGVGYYHVSDQYIALFSNFISCGVHESIYLLDGVVENDSTMQAKKIYGDSWAQSEVLFGLSFLLTVLIMPRIKHFKHLYYYKASRSEHYENIEELFTDKAIDWQLIETHYYDMLRIAISIYKGKVKASTVLRRLCSKSRKNKLYFALRELGRVERTIFLLKFIDDPDLRRVIQAATCKSEEFNQFVSWCRFGGGGVISDNLRSNQQKIIRFNHLLANMIIFHNVAFQTKAVNKLRETGVKIPNDILSGISPYWTEHLNRFGIFDLNMDNLVPNIEHQLINSEI
jgi:TnpA family transposase